MGTISLNNYKTQERLVAYFDILGYSQIIKGEDGNNFIDCLDIAVQKTKIAISKVFILYPHYEDKIKLKIYSDNFLIFIEDEPTRETFIILTWVLSILQNALFVHNALLIRGVVKKGEIFLNEDFVFGDILVDLNEMEQEAEYPRIIIDKEIESFISESDKSTVKKDFDGVYFIEYMNHSEILIKNIVEYWDKIEKEQIIIFLKKYGTYDINKLKDKKYLKCREGLIRKYIWLAERFNQVVEPKYFINYELKLNQKIMRVEIFVDVL